MMETASTPYGATPRRDDTLALVFTRDRTRRLAGGRPSTFVEGATRLPHHAAGAATTAERAMRPASSRSRVRIIAVSGVPVPAGTADAAPFFT